MNCISCNKQHNKPFVFCRYCGTKNTPSELDLIKKSGCHADWEFYFNRAGELFNERRLYEALELYTKALEINPVNTHIYIARGDCYSKILCFKREDFKYTEALTDYQSALTLSPYDVTVLNKIGCTLQSMGKHSEALSIFNQALNKHPKNIEILSGRAFSMFVLKDYAQAQVDALKALEISPRHKQSMYVYGYSLVGLGQYMHGITILQCLADDGYNVARNALKHINKQEHLN